MARDVFTRDDQHFLCVVKYGGWCYYGRREWLKRHAIRYALANRECVAIVRESKVLWCVSDDAFIVDDGKHKWIIRRRGKKEFSYLKYCDVPVIKRTIDIISDHDLDLYFNTTANGYIAKYTCSLCDAPLLFNDSVPVCFGDRVCNACEYTFKRAVITTPPLPSMREHKYHHTFKVEHTLADRTVINYPVPLTAGGEGEIIQAVGLTRFVRMISLLVL